MFTNQTTKQTFTVTAYNTPVNTTFPFVSASNLVVYDSSVNYAVDPPNTLVLNSDYQVTGGGYDSLNNMLTGAITVLSGGANNVQINDQLVVMRNVSPVQQTSALQGVMTPSAVEAGLDYQMMLIQQLLEAQSRALSFEADEFLSGTLPRNQRIGGTGGTGLYQTYSAAGAPTFSTGGTTAQSLSVLISGTPAAGQLTSWSSATNIKGIAIATGQLVGQNAAGLGGVTVGSGLTLSAGTLSATSSGGNVSNTGTPTSNQLAGWTNSTTIQGLTLGTNLSIVGTTLNAATSSAAAGSPTQVQYNLAGVMGANSGFTSDTSGNVGVKSVSVSSGACIFSSTQAYMASAPQFGSTGAATPSIGTGGGNYVYAWYGGDGPFCGAPTGWLAIVDAGGTTRKVPYYT